MTHADLAAELPFFANGTLDADRCRALEAELATCEACALELGSIEALRDALLDAERAPLEAHDPDALLRDVLARIDAEDPRPASAPAAPSTRPPWLWPLGGGLAAAVALAVGFTNLPHATGESRSVAAPVVESDTANAPAASDESVAAPPPPAPEMKAFAHRAAVQAPFAGAPPAAGLRRMLARTGRIVAFVSDVGATVANAQRVAAGEGGVVTHLDDVVPANAGARHIANLTLSVPAPAFDRTMARLAALGTTTSRSVSTEDLTGSIVDTDARLRNLRREESDLLRIMDRSGKISDVLDVEQQLASTREEIERLDGESKAMRGRVEDATIDVAISDEKTAVPAHANAGIQLSNSWNRSIADVWAFSLALVGRLFELLAFSPYLVALAIACYVAVRAVRRIRGAAAARRSEPTP